MLTMFYLRNIFYFLIGLYFLFETQKIKVFKKRKIDFAFDRLVSNIRLETNERGSSQLQAPHIIPELLSRLI